MTESALYEPCKIKTIPVNKIEKQFQRGHFKIGDGRKTRFWEDIWLSDTPLKNQYPSLYSITNRKNVFVHDVLNTAPPLNISFRRGLVGDKWDAWSHLCLRLMDIHLEETPDFLFGDSPLRADFQ